ncbi:hypothetical protein EON62_04090 [archaeon]|nr:MAG: hypothetical protein EON62_04090 [archaeon]
MQVAHDLRRMYAGCARWGWLVSAGGSGARGQDIATLVCAETQIQQEDGRQAAPQPAQLHTHGYMTHYNVGEGAAMEASVPAAAAAIASGASGHVTR